MNKVFLRGKIDTAPDINIMESGRKIARASLMTPMYDTTNIDIPHKEESHHLVAYGKLAELLHEQSHKGKELFIEGHLINKLYLDDVGKSHNVTSVVIEKLHFTGIKESYGLPVLS